MIPIGKILKSLRAQKDISLRRMGKEVGISFNTLNAYERNVIHPTLESCYKMSRFFDVPMEYFIFGDKLTQEFRDAELRALTQEADRLKSEDRRVIKSYIKKYLKTASGGDRFGIPSGMMLVMQSICHWKRSSSSRGICPARF